MIALGQVAEVAKVVEAAGQGTGGAGGGLFAVIITVALFLAAGVAIARLLGVELRRLGSEIHGLRGDLRDYVAGRELLPLSDSEPPPAPVSKRATRTPNPRTR